jgi:hypothetical protein
MPIELKESEKLVIPAKEQVTLDKLWIKQIVIQTPSPLMEGSIKMEYGAWSGNPAEDAVWRDADGNDITKTVNITDLYASMAECPELYTVFQSILAAIKPMEVYLEEKAAKLEEGSSNE